MNRADDLMREAHVLADTIRHQRADSSARPPRDPGEVAAMEARLTTLWASIRAARSAGSTGVSEPPPNRRTRPKWE